MMINFKGVVIDAERFVEILVGLAREYEGQPVGIIDDNGLKVGVLNLTCPNDDDWCQRPVMIEVRALTPAQVK